MNSAKKLSANTFQTDTALTRWQSTFNLVLVQGLSEQLRGHSNPNEPLVSLAALGLSKKTLASLQRPLQHALDKGYCTADGLWKSQILADLVRFHMSFWSESALQDIAPVCYRVFDGQERLDIRAKLQDASCLRLLAMPTLSVLASLVQSPVASADVLPQVRKRLMTEGFVTFGDTSKMLEVTQRGIEFMTCYWAKQATQKQSRRLTMGAHGQFARPNQDRVAA